MPKQIYTPSEEELIEMGFIESRKIFYSQPKLILYSQPDNAWFLSDLDMPRQFYPKSKTALLEFISNFSPNE